MEAAVDIAEPRFAALLDELLDQPEAARAQWLARRDGLTPALAARAQRLLRAQAWAEGVGLLERLPQIAPAPVRAEDLAPGRPIGPFVLERELGAGGMGSVWLAAYADRRMERRVALKLPHALEPSATLMARFRRERDILAALDHPHIARLYDAGADAAGRLYLAMEYVEGLPIDRHADMQRLNVAARVELFLRVVDAVHHAHRSLVVHRDLKPGNILVKADGDVRLLDFGIAKLLAEPGAAGDPTLTIADGGALTPTYAAPEQFLGAPITTATDVYALGVVLCRLLCGALPFVPKRATRAAIEAAVLEDEPVAPSAGAIDAAVAQARGCSVRSLRAQLRGELDTIVLKALKRAPAQRYASADALAQDLRHWLRGEPIAAMPDRWGYRLGKFVQRHALGVAVAAGVGLTMAAAGALTLAQYLAAEEQRAQAAAVKSFLADVLGESEASDSSGPDGASFKSMIDAGVARAERDFADRPALRGELLAELGRLYLRHGEHDAARATLERTLAALEGSVPDEHVALNKTRANLAAVWAWFNDAARAEPLARDALRGCIAADRECAKVRGRAQLVLGEMRHARGDVPGAAESARRAVAEYRVGYGDRHPETVAALHALARELRNNGQFEPAMARMQEAHALGQSLSLPLSRRRAMQSTAANLLVDTGRYEEAVAAFQALVETPPPREGADENLAQTRMMYASALAHLGLAEAALAQARQAREAAGREAQSNLQAWAGVQEARALSLLGRHEEAIDRLREVLAHFERVTTSPSLLREVPRRHLAEVLARAGRFDAAQSVLADSLAHLRLLFPNGHLLTAQAEDLMALLTRRRGDFDTTYKLRARARADLVASLGSQHPAAVRNALYHALDELARFGGAARRAAAVAALQTYAAAYPAASTWRAMAVQAGRQLAEGGDVQLTEVVFAH